MYGFLAIVFFAWAQWLDKKLRMPLWGGLIPLLVGLAGSMLLYASALSSTVAGWFNYVVSPLAGQLGALMGEPIPLSTVWGVVCIAGAAVTVMDLWRDHTYNSKARTALIITPIAAHGAGGGWLPAVIDAVHQAGAGMVATIVAGAVGS